MEPGHSPFLAHPFNRGPCLELEVAIGLKERYIFNGRQGYDINIKKMPKVGISEP